MVRVSNKVIEQRRVRLLGALLKHAEEGGDALELSNRQLACELHTRWRGAASEGAPRAWLPSAALPVKRGQAENAYRITAKGVEFLRRAAQGSAKADIAVPELRAASARLGEQEQQPCRG
ncbi:MAG: hypothetical protein ACLSVD_08760 [Eggerthellaceae bacterium]